MEFISNNLKETKQFLNSISFSRAVRVGIAVTIPVLLGMQFGYTEIGFAISFGAFWSSPSDISGSFSHKIISISIASALVMIVSFIKGFFYFDYWLFLPILGLLTFAIAFISIYGFRASLISFSGLMALALSFSQNKVGMEIYQYALLLGLGGIWYLLLTIIWHRINPKAETEEFLAETFELTAEFLEVRGKLIDPNEDRYSLLSKLQNLQSKLTENHNNLREILILSRKNSGLSNYQDKRLLVFAQLVDMLEMAIANPGSYNRMAELFKNYPKYIEKFQDLIFEMSLQLRLISIAGNDPKKFPGKNNVNQCFEDTRAEINNAQLTLNYGEFLMLQNLLEYQEKQFDKIKRIKWLLGDRDLTRNDFIDPKVAKRFVALQDYDPMLLLRNFSFKSTIFRHSIRLAVTVMLGYVLGSIFTFQNPFSIILIITVIMRPNYGLTRSRAKDRIIGTFIGAGIGFGMVILIQNMYVFGAMGIVSLIIAISFIQKNYRASATFITLSVVFIYAILSPDILEVIQFRILDTIVGAALSYAAMRWLWPTWEFVEIKENIQNSIRANRIFLRKISDFYKEKGKLPTSYNIARKHAFLETSNLNSAFQRMAQEPKSKQRELDSNYEMVVLNHSFLASLASVSTYIQHHKTSDASEQFGIATNGIMQNLEKILVCLNDKQALITPTNQPHFEDQLPDFAALEIRDLPAADKATLRESQEIHLVWEQLKWMFSTSKKMLKLASKMTLN